MDGVIKPIKKKVFAYITKDDKLLVFEHTQHPEAGIQVPAGTLENGETPEQGVLREAKEETGLHNLNVIAFLGEQMCDMSEFGKDECHHRYFYHLRCDDKTPETWLHHELFPSDRPQNDKTTAFEFRLYWVAITNPPTLIADHGFYVHKL